MPWTKEALDALEADRARLLEDLRAIEAVLRREGRIEAGQLQLPLASEQGKNGRPTAARTGLRAEIRRILAQYPHGLRPKDVTTLLEQQGLQLPGTTNLGTRIAGEMARMRHTRRLQKMRSGRYRLREPKEPAPESELDERS